MFTGIVEETGRVVSIERGERSSVLTLRGKKIFEDMQLGDSIAVNGVCLTVASKTRDTFTADVMAETLRRSNLGTLSSGDTVNLERAMAANGRFGGHIVSGHIDGVGEIAGMEREDNAIWVTVKASAKLLRYIIEKGSIAIDGISLTVAYVDAECFRVSLIPHTAGHTTMSEKRVGDKVNLENDMVGKYVDRLLHFKELETSKEQSISLQFLRENGFA